METFFCLYFSLDGFHCSVLIFTFLISNLLLRSFSKFLVSDIIFFNSRKYIWLLKNVFFLHCIYFSFKYFNRFIVTLLSFQSVNSMIYIISCFFYWQIILLVWETCLCSFACLEIFYCMLDIVNVCLLSTGLFSKNAKLWNFHILAKLLGNQLDSLESCF